MISSNQQKIIFLLVIFAVIFLVYRNFTNPSFLESKLIDIPHNVKCLFKEDNCESGDIDGWSICYLLMFFIIGIIAPNQYLFIIVIAILIELAKPLFHYQPKYIINPLISITGYAIGSLLSHHRFKDKYRVFVN